MSRKSFADLASAIEAAHTHEKSLRTIAGCEELASSLLLEAMDGGAFSGPKYNVIRALIRERKRGLALANFVNWIRAHPDEFPEAAE